MVLRLLRMNIDTFRYRNHFCTTYFIVFQYIRKTNKYLLNIRSWLIVNHAKWLFNMRSRNIAIRVDFERVYENHSYIE